MSLKIISNKMNSDDIALIISIFLMITIGLVALFSSSVGKWDSWAMKQGITICAILPICFVVARINSVFFYKNAYIFYIVMLVILLLVNILGYKAMGAQRWLKIGAFNLQPAEFMKIALILALAKYYSSTHISDINKLQFITPPLILIAIPVFLILKQPNLGTATLVLIIGTNIVYLSGVRNTFFIMAFFLAITSIPIIWHFMHDYQKKRVMTFLNPYDDPLGGGYNVMQSIIAIGSGGFYGKGLMEGSQGQLSFLPEKQTDFILSIISEEFGFIGLATVLILSTFIVIKCYQIAFSSSSHFARLIICGIATSFAYHCIINASMISGLMPIVGVPYPLLSYGGSNISSFMINFALVFNRSLRQYSSHL